MKTANEKASEILGHQENCCVTLGHLPCSCTHPPEVKVAAIRGTLNRKHGPLNHPDDIPDWTCLHCEQDLRGTGPCAPPIDAAMKWEMLRELAKAVTVVRLGIAVAEDAVAEEYIAAHDAGLLRGRI